VLRFLVLKLLQSFLLMFVQRHGDDAIKIVEWQLACIYWQPKFGEEDWVAMEWTVLAGEHSSWGCDDFLLTSRCEFYGSRLGRSAVLEDNKDEIPAMDPVSPRSFTSCDT
jgi:hypothetical protein